MGFVQVELLLSVLVEDLEISTLGTDGQRVAFGAEEDTASRIVEDLLLEDLLRIGAVVGQDRRVSLDI